MKQICRKYSILAIALITGILTISACNSAVEANQTNKISAESKPPKPNVTENNKEKANSTNVAQNNQATQPKELAKCGLTKAPEIKGFAIGQTVEEIDQRIFGFKAAYDKEKENETESNKKANFVLVTSGSAFPETNGLQGKEFEDFTFIWHFLDGRLVAYVVKYLDDDTSNITKVKDLLTKLTKENNLPKDGWKFDQEEGASLSCQGYRIDVSAYYQNGPSIMISDTAAEKEREKRGK